jgi:hypothetical protein
MHKMALLPTIPRLFGNRKILEDHHNFPEVVATVVEVAVKKENKPEAVVVAAEVEVEA